MMLTAIQKGIRNPLIPVLTLALTVAGLPNLHALAKAPPSPVGPVPAALRERLKLGDFYQKHLDVDGFPVLGSAKVSDDALAEAAWIIRNMLGGRKDILEAMAGQNVRAVIMAGNEYTTDVPEHADMRPKLFWDRRARGLGATPQVPVVSGGEENLLSFRHDPYPNENIFLHEFAHAIHGTGLNKVDPEFDRRLRTAYKAAMERGLWKNTYAATNHHEYWAEGVQSWFDDNAPPDALHNNIRTREQLKNYDTPLATLCKEVFGDQPWRFTKPRDRAKAGRAHLGAYDPQKVPVFRWRSTDPGEKPQVLVQTSAGDFEMELTTSLSPNAVKNFLLIALDGGFHSGQFNRFDQGGAWATTNTRWKAEWLKDLKLEPLQATTALPDADSLVALTREGDAWLGFAVFPQKPAKPPSGEIIPIGRVVKGKDILLKILASSGNGDSKSQPVEIKRVIRQK